MHPKSTPTPKPLCELRDSLSGFSARCRAARWYGALFRVGVAQDIVADDTKALNRISRAAYSAEQDDLEAVKIIKAAARDGFSDADLPALDKALRLIMSSAKKDHQISEQLS